MKSFYVLPCLFPEIHLLDIKCSTLLIVEGQHGTNNIFVYAVEEGTELMSVTENILRYNITMKVNVYLNFSETTAECN